MRLKARVALFVLPVMALGAAALSARPAFPSAHNYMVALSGGAEATNATGSSTGDIDGSGSVRLTLDPVAKRICYDFTTMGLATPLMAHIHRAPAHHEGPSVVTLFTGPGGNLHDCLLWTEERLAEIVANPSGFYVNLYTTEYPDGALRGQLAG